MKQLTKNEVRIEYDAPELASLDKAAIVDGIIRFTAYAAALSSVVVAPNIVQAIDKPLARLDTAMDGRKRRREIMRAVYYMKARGYLVGDYEHGLQLTGKAKRRLSRIQFDDIAITPQVEWDHNWRIIIYDIPEKHKNARRILTGVLRRAGCFQLQKSAWITPFPCRDAVETLAAVLEIDRYISYFEAHHLDDATPLIKRFAHKYPFVKFS